MIWTIVIFLITISVLVTIHEFGHFIVARFCGVHVECFSIGFGKKLCSYRSKKGTLFTLSAIPLGGYVKMLDGRNVELTNEQKRSAFDHKSILKRAAIIIAGPAANFIFAIVVYWVIFQVGVATYPIKIKEIIPNTPAGSVNIPPHVELKSIAGIKIDSWAEVNTILVSQMGKDNLSLTYETAQGQLYEKSININGWKFDIEQQSPITAFGFVPAPIETYPIISKIVSGSAAEVAGINVNDTIISYNNKPYDNWDDFVFLVKQGEPITLGIKRNEQIVSLRLTPNIVVNEQGEKIGVVGIYPTSNTIVKQYGIVSAFSKSIEQTKLTMTVVMRSFYQLVTGVISLKNLSGPVSIAQGAGQTASYGFVPYLFFLAFISISLGVINLVPLPMLDGGHLVFLLIEKIKGSPLSLEIQAFSYRLGFFLLMIVMIIALFNDFVRLL